MPGRPAGGPGIDHAVWCRPEPVLQRACDQGSVRCRPLPSRRRSLGLTLVLAASLAAGAGAQAQGATPSPAAGASPEPAVGPGHLGADQEVYRDDFSTPSGWTIADDELGRTAYEQGGFAVTVSEDGSTLWDDHHLPDSACRPAGRGTRVGPGRVGRRGCGMRLQPGRAAISVRGGDRSGRVDPRAHHRWPGPGPQARPDAG